MYLGSMNRKKKRKILPGCTWILIGTAFLCVLFHSMFGRQGADGEKKGVNAAVWIENIAKQTYLPIFAFVEKETGIAGNPAQLLSEVFLSGFPIYKYQEVQGMERVSVEDEDTYERLIRQEGSDEDYKGIEDGSLEYKEDALHIDGDLQNAMLKENSQHNSQKKQEEAEDKTESVDKPVIPSQMQQEISGGEFQKAQEKSYEYNWEEVCEYEDIVSAFYAVDSTTSITDQQLNLENLLGRDMSVTKKEGGPQILIYHTHSQEAFVDSVEGDVSTTIVGAGAWLAELLQEKYGYEVLHHTGEYDVEARDYAYSNSLPAIEQILAENPTIEVVIDLHRDAMAEGKKLVVDLQGRPTAQFMFFNGLSRTRENGEISYLENPYVNDNLAFSFQAQIACNEYYPGLARRIYLKAYRYNMHLKSKCMLVELGAQTNTVEEIMNACEPLAHVIAKVLSGETGDVARAAAGVEKRGGD